VAKKKKNKSKNGMSMGGRILAVAGLVTAIVFMPTTIFLCFAMLPTVVAALIDRSGKGTRAVTIGSMNIAGCTPFLIELWTKSHTPDMALTLITDPRTIIVIYCAAGAGYLIDWAMTGIIGTLMVQRGTQRLKDIKKKQKELVERWGEEVSGHIPLDEHGFPIENKEVETKNKPKK